ncbi:transglutaminaseTgpA domain-containing protein [Cellulomonas sp. P22]|uniref:transglutaminase family protein n=1 Tax=Cellulomonas sp. P22 TaxID=3373189 RepID=UPI0037BFE20C
MTASGNERGIPRGPRSLLASALVAAAVCGSLLALDDLVTPGRWLPAAVVTVLVLAVVTAATRAATRARWAPTVVGGLVAALGVLVVYGAPPGRMQVLPDTGSVERVVNGFRLAIDLVNSSFVPMQVTRPVELLVVSCAAALLLATDLVALTLAAPAWAGPVLLVVWLPGIALGAPASGRSLALTALAYLLLLALSAAPANLGPGAARRATWALAAASSVVVLTLVAGPLLGAIPGWASVHLPRLGSNVMGPVRLNDALDMRESLGPRSDQVVLRYTVASDGVVGGSTSPSDGPATFGPDGEGTDGATSEAEQDASAKAATARGVAAAGSSAALAWDTRVGAATVIDARLVGPLRAFTLRDFDGRSWEPGGGGDTVAWQHDEFLVPDGQDVDTALASARLAEVAVTVDGLREDRLPVSTFARTVSIDGSWSYDAVRDEVVGDSSTRKGTSYSMTVAVPDLTGDTLRGAGTGASVDLEPYLAVAETGHVADIRALAAQLTADASTPYDQAMALQAYFRNPQNFVYDTRVAPATSDDAVWDFIDSRRGYCVQFATSMAVLARTLGIPARLGIGFLPGTVGDDGVYTVTGRQSHAWPELYFEGSGWVRFEPTPAVQTGSPPRWSDPLIASSSTPSEDPEANAPANPVPTTTTAPPRTSIPAPEIDESEIPRALVAPLAGLLVALVIGAVFLVRRRSVRAAHLTAETAWERMRARLRPAHIVWSDARTPRQVVDLVRDRVVELGGSPLDADADSALVDLATAVERERYAPNPGSLDPHALAERVDLVVDGVTGAVSGRPARAGAASAPRDGS